MATGGDARRCCCDAGDGTTTTTAAAALLFSDRPDFMGLLYAAVAAVLPGCASVGETLLLWKNVTLPLGDF